MYVGKYEVETSVGKNYLSNKSIYKNHHLHQKY